MKCVVAVYGYIAQTAEVFNRVMKKTADFHQKTYICGNNNKHHGT